MRWIGLDWDYVTGDRQREAVHHCSRTRCPLSDRPTVRMRSAIPTAEQAEEVRTSSGVERGFVGATDAGWEHRLEAVRQMLRRVSLSRAVLRDSHADILRFLERGDFVHHIDSHGDEGYIAEVEHPRPPQRPGHHHRGSVGSYDLPSGIAPEWHRVS